jgi:hypothetical protein
MRAEQKIKVPVECYAITVIDNDIVQPHAVTYRFPLPAAATPIGPLKSPELKENKIVPSCFIPYNVLLYVSQQFNKKVC